MKNNDNILTTTNLLLLLVLLGLQQVSPEVHDTIVWYGIGGMVLWGAFLLFTHDLKK